MNINCKITVVHKPIRKAIQKKDKTRHMNKTSVEKTKTILPERGNITCYEWLRKLKPKPLKTLMGSMDTVRNEIKGLDHDACCQILANYATNPVYRSNKTFVQWLSDTGLKTKILYECMNALGFKRIPLDRDHLFALLKTCIDPIPVQDCQDSDLKDSQDSDLNSSDSEDDDEDFNPKSDISSIAYQSDFHTSASEDSDSDSNSESES